jgi:chaperonin GroES
MIRGEVQRSTSREPSVRATMVAGGTFAKRTSLLENDIHKGVRTMSLRPLQDRIIVSRVKEEEMTKGGIVIPDSAKEKPVEGKVLGVGNGKVLENGTVRKLDVKAGDTVLFGKYAGTEVKIDGEDRLILREDDILGVIEK